MLAFSFSVNSALSPPVLDASPTLRTRAPGTL
jgi:hypothetical protein